MSDLYKTTLDRLSVEQVFGKKAYKVERSIENNSTSKIVFQCDGYIPEIDEYGNPIFKRSDSIVIEIDFEIPKKFPENLITMFIFYIQLGVITPSDFRKIVDCYNSLVDVDDIPTDFAEFRSLIFDGYFDIFDNTFLTSPILKSFGFTLSPTALYDIISSSQERLDRFNKLCEVILYLRSYVLAIAHRLYKMYLSKNNDKAKILDTEEGREFMASIKLRLEEIFFKKFTMGYNEFSIIYQFVSSEIRAGLEQLTTLGAKDDGFIYYRNSEVSFIEEGALTYHSVINKSSVYLNNGDTIKYCGPICPHFYPSKLDATRTCPFKEA